MANERVIRISTELDISNILSGINKMRQEMSNINVNSSLFKDINKDLDNLSKRALSISATLKNGIPEKGVNSFLNQINEINKIYTSLPEKVKQLQVNASNVRLDSSATQRLEEINREIDTISEHIRKVLGEDLKAALKNAFPSDLINGASVLKSIGDADNKMEQFEKELQKVKDKADKLKTSLTASFSVAQTYNTSSASAQAQATRVSRNELGTEGLAALNSGDIMNRQEEFLQRIGAAYSGAAGQAKTFSAELIEYIRLMNQAQQLEGSRAQIQQVLASAEREVATETERIGTLTQEGTQITTNAVNRETTALQRLNHTTEQVGQTSRNSFNQMATSAQAVNTHLQHQDSILRQLAMRATSLIGVGAVFNYITRAVRDAWSGIKDLDKEFTQIAVVTDKTTSQLWGSFGTYSQMAQGLGVTTKDAVATSALYYQQGLDTTEVMALTAETIKMAQIAGMDFATATNQMTAALRGFNLEMEQASMVNDIFSTLAANAAVSTEELAYALTKTASIADSAGMSIDTTSAFLTKMIETTREAPENIGTAMKSIVARFEELKSNPLSLNIEVDGEEVVANKVEAAIALAGVKLRDASGQFRDLDDVFLELAKSWDGLDRNTQRYIATIAAGSRQQSRFIAMMDGYDRTLELVELAQDSEGQSAAQFLKTLDSLDSKLNKVSNSLEQIYQKFVNSDFFGGLLDSLNELLQGIGKMDAGALASFAIMGITIGNNIIRGITQAIRSAGPIVSEKFYGLVGNMGQKAANVIGKRSIEARVNNIQKDYNTKRQDIYNKYNTPINEKYHIRIEGIDKARKDLNDLENDLKDVETEIQRINNLSLEEQQNPEQQQKLEDAKNKQAKLRDKIFEQREGIQAAEEAQSNMQQELDDAWTEMQQELNTQTDEVRTNIVNAMSTIGPAAISSLTVGITSALNSENPFDAIWETATVFLAQTAPMILGQFIQFITTGGEAVTGAAIASTAGVAAIFIAITVAVTAAVALIKTAIDNNKSDIEKLKEQISQLEDKSKELSEVSERSTAEAALKKTETKKINNLIDAYDKLINKTGRTTEENQKLIEIQNELAEDYPDLLNYYDEAGNAKLKERNTWQEIVELQKESTRLAQNQAFADKMQLNSIDIQLTQARAQLLNAQHQERLNKEDINGNTTSINNGDITYRGSFGSADKILPNILSNSEDFIFNYLSHAAITAKDKGINIDEYFSKTLTQIANETDSKERVDILKNSMIELDDSYADIIEEYSNVLFEGTEDALTQYYKDFQYFIDNSNDSEYKKSQEEIQKAYRKLQTELEKSIKGYIETLSPETIEGYSEETKSTIAEQLAKRDKDKIAKASSAKTAMGNTQEDLTEYEKQIQELIDSGKITNVDGEEALKAIQAIREKSDGKLNFVEAWRKGWGASDKDINFSVADAYDSLTADEKDALAAANDALIQMLGDKTAEEAEETLNKIKTALGEDSDEFKWLQIPAEQLSEEARNAILNGLEKFPELSKLIEADFDEIYGDNGKIKELDERFQEIAQHFSYNLGEAIQNMGASDEAVNSLTNIINQGTIDQALKLVNLVSSKDLDWGNPNDIKQVAAAVYDITRNTEGTIKAVERLQSTFATISNINISPDRFDIKFQEWGKSINNIKKEYKDLSSAIEEFNEYGKLTASTIIDLVEAGNIQYLTYNKTTKAVEINAAAVQESFKTKIAEQKLTIQNTITQAKQLRDGYLLQAKLYRNRAELIKDNVDDDYKITKEGLKQLLNLEQYNAILIEDNQLKLNTAQIINNEDYFKDWYDDDKKYFANLSELAYAGGQDFAASFMSGLNGGNTAITQKINKTANKIFTLTNAHNQQFAGNYQGVSKEVIDAMFPEFDAKEAIKYYETMADGMEDLADSTTEVINTQEEYYNVISSLDGADITDYYKSAADGAKKANKELEDYISTLEKYYNLQKKADELSKQTEKAKKRWERTGKEEDKKAYENSLMNEAQVKANIRATYTVERNNDLKELQQALSVYGISAKDIKLDDYGYLDQDHLWNILKQMADNGKLNSETGKKVEDIIKDKLSEIEGDTDKINDVNDWIDNQIEELEKQSEELEHIKDAIDRLANIEQALDSIDKAFDKATEENEDYYVSGGREGIDTLNYVVTTGATQTAYETAVQEERIEQEKLQKNFEKQGIWNLFDLGPDNKLYYNQKKINEYAESQGWNLKTLNINDEYLELVSTLEDTKTAYNDLTDKISENNDKIKTNSKAIKDWTKNLRSSYSNMVRSIAEGLAELDQQQIDEVKKKYAMIQEEDDKYLDSLQKSLNKQRQLRDQARSYDDLEEQEKRLALLERDTSGANAAEIAALKKEIKDARQNLVDTEQDNIVNNISEENQKRKEEMDEETAFLQNVMDERTYDMQYYMNLAYDIVNAAIDGDEKAYERLMDIKKKTDEAYFKGTQEEQAAWVEAQKATFEEGKGWRELELAGMEILATGTSAEISKTLQQYARDDTAHINNLRTEIDGLTTLLTVVDLSSIFDDMKSSIDANILAFQNLKGEINTLTDIEKTITYKVKYEDDGAKTSELNVTPTEKKYALTWRANGTVVDILDNREDARNKVKTGDYIYQEIAEGQEVHIGQQLKNNYDQMNEDLENQWYVYSPERMGGTGGNIYRTFDSKEEAENYKNNYLAQFPGVQVSQGIDLIDEDWWKEKVGYKIFKEGGVVDYTGPAWVDGTMTRPEAFLSADDTRNIKALTEILQDILIPSNISPKADNTEVKSGDTNIEIHIDVAEIDNDYDVDQMLDQIQSRITEASEGNVTIVR